MSKTTTSSIKIAFATTLLFLLSHLARVELFRVFLRAGKYLSDNHLMLYFKAVVICIVLYLVYWIWVHRRAYPPVGGIPWLIGLGAFYLYVRNSPFYTFWPLINGYSVALADLFAFPYLLILGWIIYSLAVKFPQVDATNIAATIRKDREIKFEYEDWFGFGRIVDTLFENLQSLDLRFESLSMGIIAQWGAGKSSFINLLINRAEKHGDIIVRFNPRGSKNVAQIQEDFFEAFAREVSKYYTGFGLLLGRYTKHLGLLGQYEWTRSLGSLLKLLLPEKDVEAINEAIFMINKRIYVVIDDLDRLTGEEIMEVLKLIDRNASFHNVVFITAYDKGYVNNVLEQYLKHGLDHSFIDKYVTWEVALPETDRLTLRVSMSAYLRESLSSFHKDMVGDVLKGWSYVDEFVSDNLGSMRHLKRYWNLMICRYRTVCNNVDPADFFLLALLQYRYQDVYNNLAQQKYIKLVDWFSDDAYFQVPEDTQNTLFKELPLGAVLLIRKMFIDEPVGREGRGGLFSYRKWKLIRSKDAFPYYFQYMKDKTEEK